MTEAYRMSSLAGLPNSNIPKINIGELISSSNHLFSTKFNFAESQRVNTMVNQLPAFTVHHPLETISRPVWRGRSNIGRLMSPRNFRPNRYDQSLQGWRQNKKRRFGQVPDQGGYPPVQRQRSFPFQNNPPPIGGQFRYTSRYSICQPGVRFTNIKTLLS